MSQPSQYTSEHGQFLPLSPMDSAYGHRTPTHTSSTAALDTHVNQSQSSHQQPPCTMEAIATDLGVHKRQVGHEVMPIDSRINETGDLNTDRNTKRAHFVEMASVLTILSLIAIHKGYIRLAEAQALSRSNACARSTLGLVLGVLELCLSVMAFLIGLGAVTRRFFNRDITKFVMAILAMLSCYTFLYYFFPIPDGKSVVPDFFNSFVDDNYIVTTKRLIALQQGIALHGGVLFIMARLLCMAVMGIPKRTSFEKLLEHLSGEGRGSVLWNINLLLFGVWTLIDGRHHGMMICTGSLMAICAFWGIFMVATKAKPTIVFCAAALCMNLLTVFNLAVMKSGVVDGTSAGLVTLQAGQIFAATFLGPYFSVVGNSCVEEKARTN